MAELVVVAALTATSGRRDELVEALRREIVPTHEEGGVLRFSVHTVVDNPDQLLVVEAYRTKEDLDRHYSTPHFAEIRAVFPDLLAEPAQVFRCEPLPLGDPRKGTLD